jgi:FkbM family methyltransferase
VSSRSANIVHRGAVLLRDARTLARLGPTPFGRALLFVTYLAAPVKRRIPGLQRARIRLPVQVGSRVRKFTVSNAPEMLVIKEILAEGIYEVPQPPHETRVIVDLGANVGAATAFFLERFPSARVVAVEPDPTTYRKLAANVGRDSRVTLIHAAVTGRQSTYAELFASKASWDSRVVPGPSPGTVRVPAGTLEQILQRIGIDRVDILKIDVEGMEHQIFATPGPQDSAQLLIGEVHPTKEIANPERLVDELRSRGWEDCRPFAHSVFYLRRKVPDTDRDTV